jgi:two-component system sensor kinase
MPRYGPNGELLEILGVSRDISELRAQRAAIREAQIEAERQQTLVDERERMARDLHDDLLQALSAANLQIATAELRAGDDGGTREALSRSREDLQAAIDGARRLVTGLRARQIEGCSLGDAILGLADDLSARTGAATALEVDDIGEIDAHAEDALFRVAQEALANVAKHASAATVQIHLEREGESIVLSIVDDGRGIDSREPVRADSYGLTGMRERVHAVGGSVSVESGSHGGTCVVARVPAESQLSALPRAVR